MIVLLGFWEGESLLLLLLPLPLMPFLMILTTFFNRFLSLHDSSMCCSLLSLLSLVIKVYSLHKLCAFVVFVLVCFSKHLFDFSFLLPDFPIAQRTKMLSVLNLGFTKLFKILEFGEQCSNDWCQLSCCIEHRHRCHLMQNVILSN